MLGKIEGRRRRGCQRTRWLDDITNAMDMNLSKLWEMVRDREALHAAFHGDCKELDMTTWLDNSVVFGISDIYTFNLFQWIWCNAKIVPILASSNGFLNFLSSLTGLWSSSTFCSLKIPKIICCISLPVLKSVISLRIHGSSGVKYI